MRLRVNAPVAVQQAALWAQTRLCGKAMHLVINGEDHDDLPDALTVAALIAYLNLPEKKIAVERNLEVIPKSRYEQVTLANHDKLEIIHFIGGG